MAEPIFLNLPVRDLDRSIAFYRALGAKQNHDFSDDTAAWMALTETINVMLLTHDKYRQFTSKPIADAHSSSQVLLCTSVNNRDEVDALIATASASGGKGDPGRIQDYGFIYARSFEDPDGHHWEAIWMDMAAAGESMVMKAEPQPA